MGFPDGSVVKNSPANAADAGFDPWVGKIPWRRKWQLIPAFLPGNPVHREGWWATVHGGHKRVGHDLATKQQLYLNDICSKASQ